LISAVTSLETLNVSDFNAPSNSKIITDASNTAQASSSKSGSTTTFRRAIKVYNPMIKAIEQIVIIEIVRVPW